MPDLDLWAQSMATTAPAPAAEAPVQPQQANASIVPEVEDTAAAAEEQVLMEWFCDMCQVTIDGVRFECRVCPDDFCICSNCYASAKHPHRLISNSGSRHCSWTS